MRLCVACSEAARTEMAEIICDTFVSESAEQQVNIAGVMRHLLVEQSQGDEVEFNMFDKAQHSIFILLERDWFAFASFFSLSLFRTILQII